MTYLKKGSKVMIQGKISYREKNDEQNPNTVIKFTSIIADDIIYLSR